MLGGCQEDNVGNGMRRVQIHGAATCGVVREVLFLTALTCCSSVGCISYQEQLTGLILFWLEKRQPRGDMKIHSRE